ncbi:MAG: hypothetical protein ACODAC_03425, partial [Pseudomonadota bacterium]
SAEVHLRVPGRYNALNATQDWGNAATRELMRRVILELEHLGITGYRGFETSFGYVTSIVGSQSSMLAYRDSFLLIGAVFVISLVPAAFIAGRRKQ